MRVPVGEDRRHAVAVGDLLEPDQVRTVTRERAHAGGRVGVAHAQVLADHPHRGTGRAGRRGQPGAPVQAGPDQRRQQHRQQRRAGAAQQRHEREQGYAEAEQRDGAVQQAAQPTHVRHRPVPAEERREQHGAGDDDEAAPSPGAGRLSGGALVGLLLGHRGDRIERPGHRAGASP
ncbi:hypothetical protein [Micromonospora sp. B006]|uniref:hypothetical protein n=1 Tax=Micromonospora sp. B006 TaxID=2201999 RepID=UPI001CEF7A01|nr:hypothetical protein [Micromonospora sp. B006]